MPGIVPSDFLINQGLFHSGDETEITTQPFLHSRGKDAIGITGLKLRETFVLPQLASRATA